jgi:prolyl-tRNA synthetase
MTTGANKDEHHLRGVSVDRDISVDKWANLRTVAAGEGCVNCDGTLDVFKAVEVGHIFKLGTKYSESMGARVLLADGTEVPVVMGSYGIGAERVMTTAVELYNDAAGIIWPSSIAPFQVVVTPVNIKDQELLTAAERIYGELTAASIECLLDDRDERAGVKFKDADLIGVPYRITVGKKVKDGKVEFMTRGTGESEDVSIDSVVQTLHSKIKKM